MEKLSPTLGFYVVKDWREGCAKCIEILNFGGLGHTLSVHTKDESVVREFWRLMATNDSHSVKAVLAPEFVLEWPQSNERIRGPENFAQMNAEYPTTGRWQFRVNRLVASAVEVATQVSVTDGNSP